ncbi:MAG: 50S ribosomal protein L24e [Methanomethylophilus sp.]|jgi:large subunit ribosomal protein L24e
MVEERKCSFCGKVIEPGTGKMYVRKDGTVLYFDANRCYKNMVQLKRVPRTTLWTEKAHAEKDARQRNAAAKAESQAAAAEAPAESAEKQE